MRTAPAVNFGLPIIVSTLLALLAGAIGAAILTLTFDFLDTISQNDDAANGVFVIVESLTAVLSLASLAIIQFLSLIHI